MSTFVVVHGAWLGAWCWDRIIPRLKSEGHMIIAPDLPAHGDDKTPATQASLQGYTDRITAILDALPSPAILVGHSMAGAVISQAGEARPGKVQVLVYLSAFLMENDQSILQIIPEDKDSLAGRNLVIDERRGLVTVKPDAMRKGVFADCTDEDADWAISRIQPEPMGPFATPISVTEKRFGRLPRVYISCLNDRILTPALQRRMYTALPSRVITMESGHVPFLSAPEELCEHFNSILPEKPRMRARRSEVGHRARR